jgi:hypothetical protein
VFADHFCFSFFLAQKQNNAFLSFSWALAWANVISKSMFFWSEK